MKDPILYSFRRCPFAIRARWAIIKCELRVELREIDLKNKPNDLINKSNDKTVPFLILNNGNVIEESLDIIHWALKNQKRDQKRIYFNQIYKKETYEMIHENDQLFKYHLDRFKYETRFLGIDKEFHFLESLKLINKWNEILNKNQKGDYWLIGGHESIADWCLWPFVRQFKIACEQQKIPSPLKHPIKDWLKKFENNKNFKLIMRKYDVWRNNSDLKFFPEY
tara:strand:+ start:4469 stop:5137 length:669 start_codon:yes stop_codon:yes gene_type:complete